MKPMPDNQRVARWLGLFGLLLAAALNACAATNDKAPIGGETNWLKRCESSAACGDALSCECGVCTEVCERGGDACGLSGTTCVAISELLDACAGNEGASGGAVCVVECKADRDCEALGAGYGCDAGLCVKGQAASNPCADKSCGDSCSPCDETTVMCAGAPMFCDASGECRVGAVECAYDPCADKACGEGCRLCAPDDDECVETKSIKFCDTGGRCQTGEPICGGGTPIPCDCATGYRCCAGMGCTPETEVCPGEQYAPCGGKACGDSCTLCALGDADCEETDVEKFCQMDGSCRSGEVPTCDPCADKACGEVCAACPAGAQCLVADSTCRADGSCVPGPADDCSDYDPCAGKRCGDGCRECDPQDKDCLETEEVKYCQADMTCSGSAPQCAADERCADKACGEACQVCPPGAQCFVEDSYCRADGSCIPGVAEDCNYEPCGGKVCGATCTVCDPLDTGCAETAVIKYCQPDKTCDPVMPACGGFACGDSLTCDSAAEYCQTLLPGIPEGETSYGCVSLGGNSCSSVGGAIQNGGCHVTLAAP